MEQENKKFYELSEEGFDGTPEVGKTVTVTGRKHVVA